jgi:hypothetical protein
MGTDFQDGAVLHVHMANLLKPDGITIGPIAKSMMRWRGAEVFKPSSIGNQ